MGNAKQIELLSKTGDTLKGLSWLTDKSRANVIIMEGMEEHCSRYDYFAKYLNKEGFDVYALDTYGQGLNAKEDLSNIGMWPEDGFVKQVEAVDTLVLKLQEETKKPVFLFSHSMGSFMCQDYLERFPDHVNRVVLCGSGSKNPAVGIGYTLAKMIVKEKNKDEKAKLLNNLMFGNFNKKIKDPRTPFDWLSVNTENVDKYIADPLCGFGPRNGFCKEFLKGMSVIHKDASLKKLNKDVNIFIISGAEDPVTTYSKAVGKLKEMYNKYGVKNVETKIYDGLRHEILNEDRKDEVCADVANFFKKGL